MDFKSAVRTGCKNVFDVDSSEGRSVEECIYNYIKLKYSLLHA